MGRNAKNPVNGTLRKGMEVLECLARTAAQSMILAGQSLVLAEQPYCQKEGSK